MFNVVTMPKGFRPMKAEDHTPERLEQLFQEQNYLYGSPKIDGVRCVIIKGKALSNTLKPLPNTHIQRCLSHPIYEGFDGELTVGPAYGPKVFQRSISGVMTEGGSPNFQFHIFDCIADGVISRPYEERYFAYSGDPIFYPDAGYENPYPYATALKQRVLYSVSDVLAYEQDCIAQGYEGIMLRTPNSPYKFGRSTLKQGWLLKVKRFKDSEAEIIGTTELMHNDNEAKQDNLGLQKRSSISANKRPGDCLGSLIVKDLYNPLWTFEVGTGFDQQQRIELWSKRGLIIGSIIKYKYLEVGVVDAPRHPVFLGFRPKEDLG